MKPMLTLILAGLSAPALAHPAGGMHLHPHPDPVALVAMGALALVVTVAALRGRRE